MSDQQTSNEIIKTALPAKSTTVTSEEEQTTQSFSEEQIATNDSLSEQDASATTTNNFKETPTSTVNDKAAMTNNEINSTTASNETPETTTANLDSLSTVVESIATDTSSAVEYQVTTSILATIAKIINEATTASTMMGNISSDDIFNPTSTVISTIDKAESTSTT